jgi:hypothetical protein
MQTIYDFVRKQRDDYRSDTIEIVEGYEFSQYKTLNTIELYHNSRFLSGNKDSLGREKPFCNICKFRVNVAVRATDLDTKDVKIEAERVSDKSLVASFVLNLKSRNWMKRSGFATFLNEMGQTRAKYGGVLIRVRSICITEKALKRELSRESNGSHLSWKMFRRLRSGYIQTLASQPFRLPN